MGDIHGFLKHERIDAKTQEPTSRKEHFKEFVLPPEQSVIENQSSRCMDCGIPFCQNGCPLGNLIPDFNQAVYEGDWKNAFDILQATNNFPEFTGRICPAPCEGSCVLGLNSEAVTIEHIEKTIAEKAFEKGYIYPRIPKIRHQEKVAIIGSGPAGLACADQLNQLGYNISVYEKSDRIGGLLRYGIPDFKLDKSVVDRRINLLRTEGISFYPSINIGVDITIKKLDSEYDAIVFCTGSEQARELDIKGRHLKGVHFAMEFLTQNNKRIAGDSIPEENLIDVKNLHVVVIGGGDTGSDCLGTSLRQGAKSITQLEIMGKPPIERSSDNPWPLWPMTLRQSSSQEEGGEQVWSVATQEFLSNDGVHLSGIKISKIEWQKDSSGKYAMQIIPSTEKIIPCDRALIAVGFANSKMRNPIPNLKLSLDEHGHIATNNYQTNTPKFFSAGDARRGQSLVVWAIAEGRECAEEVHTFLQQSK